MKQSCSVRKRNISGFTLLEVVIVMGIISILLGVLVPTMRTYMTRSRLNTANSNAKVIFNSLQTIMQEYEFSERSLEESMFYGTAKKGNILLYCVNGMIDMNRCSVNADTGASPQHKDGTAFNFGAGTDNIQSEDIGSNSNSAAPGTLGARMNRLYTDYGTMTWCAYIKDYSVAGVLCATSTNSRYIGGYPLQIQERDMKLSYGSTSIEAQNIPAALTGGLMPDYCRMAWKTDMNY